MKTDSLSDRCDSPLPRGEAIPLTDELRRQLEAERCALKFARDDAERQRRRAELLESVAAVEDASVGLDEYLAKLLELVVKLGPSDFAVVRLRKGDGLCLRAAVGIAKELWSDNVWPTEGLDSENLSPVSSLSREALARHPPLCEAGVRALYRVSLSEGSKLVGVIELGLLSERELSAEISGLLQALAPRVTAAITRQRTQEELRQLLVSRDEILSVVTHDLRNPIGVITLAATSLHQRVNDPSTRRAVERILRAAQRGEHLIRDLLDVSAIEGGRFAIEKNCIEAATAILTAVESQQGLAASASVVLGTDLSPDLPAMDCDEERLLEVLENLIGNAVKFSNAGGSVVVGASCLENEVLIWVKDNGQGILPEHLPYLFDRMWQARKRDRRGTGLGLTICKAIVEAHGGRIWAESTYGVGTTLFFTIPVVGANPTRENPALANILLVDDRPENLLSLRAILDRPDYRLVTASSGQEALSLALREQFSVALIDIAMPGISGLEVAVHMKELERSRDVPIIFVTAFGDDPQEIHRAYEAGGADYLVKPLDPEIVRKKVAVFVELSRRRAQTIHPPKEAE